MFRARTPRPIFPSLRLYSTTAEKPPLKLVAELRKLTEVSITKAREALAASNNDVSAALEWLQNDLAISGAQKAAKVAHRAAGEGLIGSSILSRGTGSPGGGGGGGVRASLVELNCETDFVARNALFGRLVADVAHTAAFLAEPDSSNNHQPPQQRQRLCHAVPREQFLDAPLLSAEGPPSPSSAVGIVGSRGTTVGNAIRDAIAKLGENIVLQRVLTVAQEPVPRVRGDLGLRVTSYTHGGVVPTQGRIGALALIALKSPRLTSLLGTLDFREQLERVERSLARQIVGFDTPAVRGEENALYNQPFMMFGDALEGETVQAGLARWAKQKQMVLDTDRTDTGGLEVVEFVKWTVGEIPDKT
jgi:elongation factor Ts